MANIINQKNKKWITKIILAFAISLYLFHFLFFWIFEGTDSYFYWAFSNFLRTGKYLAPYPYFYSVPSTMEPPLYSFFIFIADSIKRADVVIHFIHILSILLSGLFIYKILKYYFQKNWVIIITSIFLLIPAHFIYVSHLVAESIAVFFCSLYLYLSHLIINQKKVEYLKYLLVISSIMTLQRYNFLPLFLLAIILFFFNRFRKSSIDYLSLIFSLLIIVGWIFINQRLNGAWSISNSEGKHLYNRIVHFDRLLPSDDNPSFRKFKEIVGENRDYYLPWWYFEPKLMEYYQSETKSSQLLQEVALAALKTDPFRYIINTPKFFLFAHNTNDMFHNKIFYFDKGMEKNCRQLGNIEFCRPIISTNYTYLVWNKIIQIIDYYYLSIWRLINFFVLFPSIIYALWQRNKYIKFCAVSYLTCIFLFISIEAPLPRYTYIFRPMGFILISFLIYRLLFNCRKHNDKKIT